MECCAVPENARRPDDRVIEWFVDNERLLDEIGYEETLLDVTPCFCPLHAYVVAVVA